MKYLRGTPEQKVWLLAAEQFGVVGRAQVVEAGMSPKAIHDRIATGQWERICEAVYRMPGVADSWRQRLMAGLLLMGDSAVISHRSMKGRKGAAVIGNLITSRVSGRPSESLFEVRLRRLLVAADLPPPVTHYQVIDDERIVARVDFAYPEYRLAVEALGFQYHSGKPAFERDVERRGDLNAMGWRVVEVTWDQLARRPQQVVTRITQALLDAGWTGRHERSG